MNKIMEFLSSFKVKLSKSNRFIIIVVLIITLCLGLLSCLRFKNPNDNIEDNNLKVDQNVYMYEEVVFSDEIYLKCIGINATKEEDIYILNLTIDINQWNTDRYINKQDIKSDYFSIKQVDINAKSSMSVFLNNVVKATFVAGLEAGILGEINVVESILSFSGDYLNDTIENASTKKGKKIKASKNQFEPFKPSDSLGKSTRITIFFEIPKDVYESNYILVLSVDTKLKFEKNIFLTLRPNMEKYNVSYDANYDDNEVNLIEVNSYNPGIIHDFPNLDLNKKGYKFSYWTSERNNKQTRVRNLYFYTNKENETFPLYAYYEKILDLEQVICAGESIYMKNKTYNIVVDEFKILNSFIIKDKQGEEIEYSSNDKSQLLFIDVTIIKQKDGSKHKLDNSDDFYLVNRYLGYDVRDHYGYLKEFKKIKPINDYNWIGLIVDDIGEYNIQLLFEINSKINVNEEMLFLEIDFFYKEEAQTIYLIKRDDNK